METGASSDLAAEQTATDRARPHAGGSVARANLCFNDWPLEPFLTPRDFHPPSAGIAIYSSCQICSFELCRRWRLPFDHE